MLRSFSLFVALLYIHPPLLLLVLCAALSINHDFYRPVHVFSGREIHLSGIFAPWLNQVRFLEGRHTILGTWV